MKRKKSIRVSPDYKSHDQLNNDKKVWLTLQKIRYANTATIAKLFFYSFQFVVVVHILVTLINSNETLG